MGRPISTNSQTKNRSLTYQEIRDAIKARHQEGVAPKSWGSSWRFNGIDTRQENARAAQKPPSNGDTLSLNEANKRLQQALSPERK